MSWAGPGTVWASVARADPEVMCCPWPMLQLRVMMVSVACALTGGHNVFLLSLETMLRFLACADAGIMVHPLARSHIEDHDLCSC